MRFGLFGGARTDPGEQVADSQIYGDYIDYICEAEALGHHGVFLVEHHFTGFGQVSATLNLLTYLAAKTTTLRLGTAVLVLPWHNPALLAEQAATLDLLSNGRFDFGVGKGYRWGEFHGFCMPMAEAEARYQETLAFLRKAWTSQGRSSHQGKYWHYEDIAAARLEFGAYRASIQVFEPTSLTATFEKKRCSGSPLRVPRCSSEKSSGPAFL
jgi:alkanesulfonate monooxygenase SsuD/methylene tetrahydromethanopterin reductase-like flavin-dependent oxidoreductase (luciferase family)